MLKLIIYSLFYFWIGGIQSADSSYEKISSISFPTSLSLEIQRNILSTNHYNIKPSSSFNFDIGTSYSKIIVDEKKVQDGQSSHSFGNMIFVYWKPEEVLSSVTVSMTNGNCASPMIFSSKTIPIVRIDDEVGKLELQDNVTDFSEIFGSSQKITDASYTSSEIGTKYFYINVICFFYSEVGTKVSLTS